MSALKQKWDVPCPYCGTWPTIIRLHDDGSIAALEHNDCPNAPPESGEPPKRLGPGEEFPNKWRPQCGAPCVLPADHPGPCRLRSNPTKTQNIPPHREQEK